MEERKRERSGRFVSQETPESPAIVDQSNVHWVCYYIWGIAHKSLAD